MAKSTFQPDEIVLQKEEYSYGFIIEVLTSGLYPNKYHVLREYVQNSYDAIKTWRDQTGNPKYGKIKIKIANPSITIYDDGVGMDWEKINQYRYVGYSEKKTGEGVGFRGIGKLSGISVADKLIVTTSPVGIGKRYQLIFNADAMLAHIMHLKLKGENIPLNDLIKAHTSLNQFEEDPDIHYTMVELYNIKSDSRLLMDEAQVIEYLGMNVPVDFDPGFQYGQIIDKWLREYVSDYDTVQISLDGKSIYKPYISELNYPQKSFVYAYDDNDALASKSDAGEPLAFYWYCEHMTKGQFLDKKKRGMFYRAKNFAVGTNQLPRITLWNTTPERAYYFWGEIHICDPEMIPSSDRENFEQNDARERFYQYGVQISKTLNTLAGGSSAKRNAKEFIERAEDLIHTIQDEAQEGKIPTEIKFSKMFSIRNAVIDVEKRLKDAPKDYQIRGREIIAFGNTLIKNLEKESFQSDDSKMVYDIREELNLGSEASKVYEIIIQCIEEELRDNPDLFERLIKKIHTTLSEHSQFGKSQ